MHQYPNDHHYQVRSVILIQCASVCITAHHQLPYLHPSIRINPATVALIYITLNIIIIITVKCKSSQTEQKC